MIQHRFSLPDRRSSQFIYIISDIFTVTHVQDPVEAPSLGAFEDRRGKAVSFVLVWLSSCCSQHSSVTALTSFQAHVSLALFL